MCTWATVKVKGLGPLELELQVVGDYPMWVLGTGFGVSVRAASDLNLCHPSSHRKLCYVAEPHAVAYNPQSQQSGSGGRRTASSTVAWATR